MVTVSGLKENVNSDSQVISIEESLRDERRRTGRYVATVIAIFVSLFGLYQGVARGIHEYAALFLPVLIMFLYVLWISYASRSRGKKTLTDEDQNNEKVVEPADNSSEINLPSKTFCRTYSIA